MPTHSTSHAALPLALNEFTTMNQSFEADLTLCQQLAIDRIEVCQIKMAEDAAQARRQLERVREAGLTVTSFQPRVHGLFPDRMAQTPQPPKARMDRFKQAIDLVADIFPDSNIPLVVIGGAAPDHDSRHARETALAMFPDLADHAAQHGLRIALEPIHPVLMNVDTFVYSLDGALDIIEHVDRANFGLVFDVWHLWQEAGIARRIEAVIDRVFIVHISDWLTGGPRRLDDRGIPGTGQINLPPLLDALRQAGYDGDYALEILSDNDLPDSLWQADPARVVTDSRNGWREAWKKV